jgi:hypothetical protein
MPYTARPVTISNHPKRGCAVAGDRLSHEITFGWDEEQDHWAEEPCFPRAAYVRGPNAWRASVGRDLASLLAPVGLGAAF